MPKSAINQKESPKLKLGDIGLTGDNKVLLITVCSPTSAYSSRNQRFFSMGKINRLMVSNRTMKIRISENNAPISISHGDNLTKYFPDIDFCLSAQSD